MPWCYCRQDCHLDCLGQCNIDVSANTARYGSVAYSNSTVAIAVPQNAVGKEICMYDVLKPVTPVDRLQLPRGHDGRGGPARNGCLHGFQAYLHAMVTRLPEPHASIWKQKSQMPYLPPLRCQSADPLYIHSLIHSFFHLFVRIGQEAEVSSFALVRFLSVPDLPGVERGR